MNYTIFYTKYYDTINNTSTNNNYNNTNWFYNRIDYKLNTMKLTKEELNVLMVALDHMQEYLDDLSLEPMSEIFDLDNKYKSFESLKYKLNTIKVR